MKKFTAILLALVLVLGLAACSSNKPQNPQPTPQETTQEPQTQATEDPGPAPATINVIYHPTICAPPGRPPADRYRHFSGLLRGREPDRESADVHLRSP